MLFSVGRTYADVETSDILGKGCAEDLAALPADSEIWNNMSYLI